MATELNVTLVSLEKIISFIAELFGTLHKFKQDLFITKSPFEAKTWKAFDPRQALFLPAKCLKLVRTHMTA